MNIKDYLHISHGYYLTQMIVLIVALLFTACGAEPKASEAPSLGLEGEFATSCENGIIASVKNRDVKSVIKLQYFNDAECKEHVGYVVYERTIKIGPMVQEGLYAVDVTYDSMYVVASRDGFARLFGVTDFKPDVPNDFTGLKSGGEQFPQKGQTYYVAMKLEGNSLSPDPAAWRYQSGEATTEDKRTLDVYNFKAKRLN